jgi:hypothetical protein
MAKTDGFPHRVVYKIGNHTLIADAVWVDADDDNPEYYDIYWDEEHLNLGDPWYVAAPSEVPDAKQVQDYIAFNTSIAEDHPALVPISSKKFSGKLEQTYEY